jgi:dTDP-4-dehydrorhamnose reductase
MKDLKPRLLITGASGLLGATALQMAGDAFDTLGVYQNHRIELEGCKTRGLDLTHENDVLSALNEFKPQIVFHTAALTNIDACEKDKSMALKINSEVPGLLAKWCADSAAKLVHVSTDAFFTGSDGKYDESFVPTPLNFYGETKLRAEEAVLKYSGQALILRTNIYGWNFQPKLSLAEWMLVELKSGRPTTLFSDVFYSPLLTNTFFECAMDLVTHGASGLFHLASDDKISKLEFGQRLAQVFKIRNANIKSISVDAKGLTAPRSKNMALDNQKLKQTLGITSLSVASDLVRFSNLNSGFYATTRTRLAL